MRLCVLGPELCTIQHGLDKRINKLHNFRGKGMHAQKNLFVVDNNEKPKKIAKREIKQADSKVILFFVKFRAKCLQNWPIKISLENI